MSETVFELLRESAERWPSEPFLERRGRWLTYYDFRELVMEVGAGLMEEEIGPGQHVALALPVGPDLVVAWMAHASIGATAVLGPPEGIELAASIGKPGAGGSLRLEELEGTHGCSFWPDVEETDVATVLAGASGPIRHSQRDCVVAGRELARREGFVPGGRVVVAASCDPDAVMTLTLGAIAAGGVLVFR